MIDSSLGNSWDTILKRHQIPGSEQKTKAWAELMINLWSSIANVALFKECILSRDRLLLTLFHGSDESNVVSLRTIQTSKREHLQVWVRTVTVSQGDEEYNLIRIGFLFCSLLNCARYTEMMQITMPHCSVLEPRRFTKRNSTAGGEIQNDSNLEYNYDQISYDSQLYRILLSSYTQAPMHVERALPQVAHVSKDLVVSTLQKTRQIVFFVVVICTRCNNTQRVATARGAII